jgi:hypothetical protein
VNVSVHGLNNRVSQLEAAEVRALDDAIERGLRQLGIDPNAPLAELVAAGVLTEAQASEFRRQLGQER